MHDLRHTFGVRLRAAGVSFEDRQDLLEHYAGSVIKQNRQNQGNGFLAGIKKAASVKDNHLFFISYFVVRPRRFERPTTAFGGRFL